MFDVERDVLPPLPFGASLEDDALTRRAFLRRTLAGAVFLALPASLLGGLGARAAYAAAHAAIPHHLRVFSPGEYLVFRAAADRIVPGGDGLPPASAAGVAEAADSLLARTDPEIAEEIAHLLTFFGSHAASFFFGGWGRPFLDMTPEAQDHYLGGWMRSALPFRRTAFKALKSVAMACYYGDQRSWAGIGYQGPLVAAAEGPAR